MHDVQFHSTKEFIHMYIRPPAFESNRKSCIRKYIEKILSDRVAGLKLIGKKKRNNYMFTGIKTLEAAD